MTFRPLLTFRPRYALALLLAFSITPGLTALAQKPGGAPQGPVPVVTAQAQAVDVGVGISAVGSLLAGEAADINSEIAGRVEKILFDEGQAVKKNDILLQIDDSLIKTELEKANAAYKVALATFNRDDGLKKQGFVSSQKWDLSKSEMETARAAVENAKIRLQKTTIRAPFAGIVGLRSFSVGQYVDTGKPLTSIVSVNPLKLEFSVPEKNYADIKNGQTVDITVDAWPADTFKGTIYAIDPHIDVQTRNFKVKASVPNDADKLRPGMYARASIAVSTKASTLMIPEEAVIPEGGKTFVMKVSDGKAAKTEVTLGLRRDSRVEVTSGLTDGDQVITAGLQRVKDGSAVKSGTPADSTAAPATP